MSGRQTSPGKMSKLKYALKTFVLWTPLGLGLTCYIPNKKSMQVLGTI